MPVKKDAAGNRYVELETIAPGTPEQVWNAIATGPGITSWFVPTRVEERVGGKVLFDLGGGIESPGRVTAWEPPRRFAYEEPDWMEGAPPIATECLVKALSGETCRVRMVHSLFTSAADWDGQLESMQGGWPGFFRVLDLYLRHHADQVSAAVRPMGQYAGTLAEAWEALAASLGIGNTETGARVSAVVGKGRGFEGVVESGSQDENQRQLILRVDRPSPGVAMFAVWEWEGVTNLGISIWFYGDDAVRLAATEKRVWQEWIDEYFPSANGPE